MHKFQLLLLGSAVLLLAALAPGAVAQDALERPDAAVPGQKTPRPPIVITDDTMFTPANGVVDGSGTAVDPYVISGWEIDGKVWAPSTPLPSSPFPPGIFIQGTDDHVVVEGNHVLDNPRSQVMVADAEHVTVRENLLQRTADAPRRAPFDDGVTILDSKDVTVADNTIKQAGEPRGVNGIIAVTEFRDQSPPELQDLTIHDNTVRNSGDLDGEAHGIVVDAGLRVEITQNTVRNRGEVELHQAFELRNLTGVAVRDNVARDPDPALASEGIKAANLEDATLEGNLVRGQDRGVDARDGTDVRYRDNTLQNHAERALRLADGRRPVLEGNTVSGSGTGLVLESTEDATARDNTLFGNDQGLSVLGSTVAAYGHDIDASNTVEGEPVRYLVDPTGTIDGEALEAGYLALVSAEDARLEGTPALPPNGQGLLLAGGRNVTVDAGTLSGHGTSLKAVGVRDLAVGNLTGEDAILSLAPDLRVHNSTLRHADGDGLVVGPGSNGASLENLTIEGHGQGVGLVVDRSDGTVGHDLLVEGNDAGVRVVEVDQAGFHGSSIALNDRYGLKAVDRFGSSTFVDATDNWWGDPDGPENYGGNGNAVVTGDNAVVAVHPVLSSAPGDAGDPSSS